MNRILGKDTLKEAEERLAAACKSLLMKDVVCALSIVETKTGKKRLTSLLKFKDVSKYVNFVQRLPDSHCLYVYHG